MFVVVLCPLNVAQKDDVYTQNGGKKWSGRERERERERTLQVTFILLLLSRVLNVELENDSES